MVVVGGYYHQKDDNDGCLNNCLYILVITEAIDHMNVSNSVRFVCLFPRGEFYLIRVLFDFIMK